MITCTALLLSASSLTEPRAPHSEASAPGLPAMVIISEFLADNEGGLLDEDGDASDWIEIWNGASSAKNLAGWSLSDDSTILQKWSLPSITLQPGQFLVVFASGKDRSVAGSQLHTNFKLDKAGEALILVKSDGVSIHSIWDPFPAQTTDVSFGLDPAGIEAFFSTPTPGAPNQGGGPPGVVADTQFSVDRGFYDAPLSVAITSITPGASIRYTTNGSAPSVSQGILYTGPVSISKTTVLRAIAYLPGWLSTDVDTQTYVFLDDVIHQPFSVPGYPNPFYDVGAGSDVAMHDYEMDPQVVNDPDYAGIIEDALRAAPTLSLALDPGSIFGPLGFYDTDDVVKACSVEVLYPDDPESSHQENGGIEGHSHVRLKRSLRLNFTSEFGAQKFETDLLQRGPLHGDTALDSYDRLILRAGNNRSWARNWNPEKTTYVLDEFYRSNQIDMSGFGSRGTFVHMYVNGLYWGLYNVIERPDAKWTKKYFGGAEADWFANNHGGPLSGDSSAFNWLAGGLTNLDMSVGNNYAQLQQFLDVTSFSDYLILAFWFGLGDWPLNNWYGGNRNDTSPLGALPYRFFCWDGEWSWDAPFGFPNPGQAAHVHPDFLASKSGGSTIPKIWHSARKNAEFMTLFHDRVHRHLHNGGALAGARAKGQLQYLTGFVREAVVAESARWGDSLQSLGHPLYERDVHWQAEVDKLLALIDGNAARLISALRAQGFYPSIDPPVLSVHGGEIYSTTSVKITNPNPSGNVYFTLDGSDPRLPGGAVNPAASQGQPTLLIATSKTLRARVKKSSEWSALTDASFVLTTSSANEYGCGYNPSGSLSHLYGAIEIGSQPVFGLENPYGTQSPGSLTGLIVHVQPDSHYPCGLPLPGLGMGGPGQLGEVLVQLPLAYPLLLGPAWTGAGSKAPISLQIPHLPQIAGGAIFLQGVIFDPSAAFGVSIGLTNALTAVVEL